MLDQESPIVFWILRKESSPLAGSKSILVSQPISLCKSYTLAPPCSPPKAQGDTCPVYLRLPWGIHISSTIKKKTTYFVAFINLFVGVLVRELLCVRACMCACVRACVRVWVCSLEDNFETFPFLPWKGSIPGDHTWVVRLVGKRLCPLNHEEIGRDGRSVLLKSTWLKSSRYFNS